MQRQKAFLKKTKKGQVTKVVKEHYLRDDLYCGSLLCKECVVPSDQPVPLSNTVPKCDRYLIVDTNVVLHQMDVLESTTGLFNNMIFLSTVMEEAKHRQHKTYMRIRALHASNRTTFVFSNEHHRSCYVEGLPGESPNDRNDRAIRSAARWYSNHLRGTMEVLLLTNDADNRRKAEAEGLKAMTMQDFVQANAAAHPSLPELLAETAAKERDAEKKSDWVFTPHLSEDEIKAGVDSGKLKKGTFRVDRDYWSEASVSQRGSDSPIFIPGMQLMNRAIDGDIVAVELLPKAQWKAPSTRLAPRAADSKVATPSSSSSSSSSSGETKASGDDSNDTSGPTRATGRIVGIIKRNWRPYCGSFEVTDKKSGAVLFLSVNKRIPKIRVDSRQIETLMDKRILVQIDSWPPESHYPKGHYVKTLGDIGDRDTETSVLLIEHDVPNDPWTLAVLKCLPPADYTIPAEEIARRVDHRETNIYSIDPPGCKDIDDALHLTRLPNGNYEVGVHIADVSHFIKPDSALDIEAAFRGTSVYLVNKRIDMIPGLLSTDMCSLHANVERLTFSSVWEINDNAEIIDTKFYKSVIKSKAAMTYARAQELIDSPGMDDTCVNLRIMNRLAKKLKQNRISAGALQLASPEVRFLLDKTEGTPTDVEMYQLKETHSLVEEFMLLSNISVAKQTLKFFPTFACLRRHPTPPVENYQPLIRAARAMGFSLDVHNSKALADSLDKAEVPGYPYFNQLIRIMATRCMTQAVYFSSGDHDPKEYNHYGLAAPVYTHFTSPIRRYADIIVHRLLSASLGLEPLPTTIQDRERMRDVSEGINHRNRMAQLAGRASGELYQQLFFKDKVVQDDAMVIQVRSTGVRVLVPRYGLEGTISVCKENEGEVEGKNPYVYDEEACTLTGPDYTFKIFDQLKVVIYVQKSKARREWLTIDIAGRAGAPTPTISGRDHSKAAKAAKAAEAAASSSSDVLSTSILTLSSEEKQKLQKKRSSPSSSDDAAAAADTTTTNDTNNATSSNDTAKRARIDATIAPSTPSSTAASTAAAAKKSSAKKKAK